MTSENSCEASSANRLPEAAFLLVSRPHVAAGGRHIGCRTVDLNIRKKVGQWQWLKRPDSEKAVFAAANEVSRR